METRTPLENAWRSNQSPRSLPSLIRAATRVNKTHTERDALVLLLVLEATTPASQLVPLASRPPQMGAKE
jgi:hypothetical protein